MRCSQQTFFDQEPESTICLNVFFIPELDSSIPKISTYPAVSPGFNIFFLNRNAAHTSLRQNACSLRRTGAAFFLDRIRMKDIALAVKKIQGRELPLRSAAMPS